MESGMPPFTVEGRFLEGPILVQDKDGDGVISFGDSVKFDTETNVVGNAPLVEVNLNCYHPDGSFAGGWWGRPGQDAGLYSPIWKEGPAHCKADLGYFDKRNKFHILDSIEFDVVA